MNFLKKIFTLPTPEALPMRQITNEPAHIYCWEDYHREMKRDYPIRYFFNHTVTQWWRVHVSMNINHFLYWIESHTVKKYHIIDLRQPKTRTDDDYTWGYITHTQKLTLACFTILCDYIEEYEETFNVNYAESLLLLSESLKKTNGLEKESLAEELKVRAIAWNLYRYWTIGRKLKLKQIESLRSKLYMSDGEEKTALREQVHIMEESFHLTEDLNLQKLLKIRDKLWV